MNHRVLEQFKNSQFSNCIHWKSVILICLPDKKALEVMTRGQRRKRYYECEIEEGRAASLL